MNPHLDFNLLLQGYTYEDIREQEEKCKADPRRMWIYDGATNTWSCPLQSYDNPPLQRFDDEDDSLSEAPLAGLRGSTKAVN